ncbi:MAG: choice-of-anchor L domain-containing protein [Flavobacteriales bacterium]
MKLRYAIILLSSATGMAARAQLVLDGARTPAQLVQQTLPGPGVTVSNVTFNGIAGSVTNEQIGAFYGANSILQLDSGVVLTTGPISVAEGPNNSGTLTGELTDNFIFDEDLDNVSGETTMNGAVLEFDFVPQFDSLSFHYAFASEEYLEWVGSPYNDVFGFFISGPGIQGPFNNDAENLAVVPGTFSYVGVNTVNPGQNPGYYQNNGNGSTAPYNSDPYYIQFDGFTRDLSVGIRVQCGQTYHMKMAIADASDQNWDSGVFIIGGTFMSTGGVGIAVTTSTGDGLLAEGCGAATCTVTRTGTNGPLTVPITLGGAASNADVDGFPSSVTIPAGASQVQFTFTAVSDGSAEGAEPLTISVGSVGACGSSTSTAAITINDPPALTITLGDVVIDCSGAEVVLEPQVSGDTGDLDFAWNTGESTPSITVPGTPGHYNVIVTDDCGTTASGQAMLTGLCGISIPNVITPDNDGTNDRFMIAGIEGVSNTVRIYNRWGQTLLEATNYDNMWDGDGASDGTYYYEIRVTGYPEPFTGHLTILHAQR